MILKFSIIIIIFFFFFIKNNIIFLLGLLHHPDFTANRISTKYIDIHLADLLQQLENRKKTAAIRIPLAAALVFSLLPRNKTPDSIWNSIGYWRPVPEITLNTEGHDVTVTIRRQALPTVDFEYDTVMLEATLTPAGAPQFNLTLNGQSHPVHIFETAPGVVIVRHNGFDYTIKRNDVLHIAANNTPPPSAATSATGNICSPMPGKVIKVAVETGTAVQAGDLLLIVEAMKMENNILSPKNGTVTAIEVAEGDKVDTVTTLIHIEDSNLQPAPEDTSQVRNDIKIP